MISQSIPQTKWSKTSLLSTTDNNDLFTRNTNGSGAQISAKLRCYNKTVHNVRCFTFYVYFTLWGCHAADDKQGKNQSCHIWNKMPQKHQTEYIREKKTQQY